MAALKWARQPRPNLGGPAAAVLRVLADHANSKAACWPSVATIANESGYSRRTVQYALRKLEAENLLKTRQGGRSNVYLLLMPGVQELHPSATQGAQELHPRGARAAHQGRKSCTQSLKKPHEDQSDALTRKGEEQEHNDNRVSLEQIQTYMASIGKRI